MWQRIAHLIRKELLAVWRDRKSRMVLIGPPLLQLVVFSFAITQEVRNLDIAVLNQDLGVDSRELVARFAASPYFRTVGALRGMAEIGPALDSRDVIAVVQIGSDFSRSLAAGNAAPVQILLDGRRSNAAQIVQGYALTIVDSFNADLSGRHGHKPPARSLVARAWFNPNLESLWSTVPSLMVILTMLVGVIVTALSVARERELGTFEQLLVSPLRPIEILIGKTVPALIIGLAEGTAILLAAVFAFRVPFTGSLPLLYAGMVLYLAAVIGVGLFISSLVATQQQAVLGAFTFMAPAMLLSGFATPVENMPDWLQILTLGDPARFFLVIVKGIFLKDMPASEVAQSLWPMLLIAVATLSGATWFFRRRLQ
jgi:ABC-2 type transport system permease protein